MAGLHRRSDGAVTACSRLGGLAYAVLHGRLERWCFRAEVVGIKLPSSTEGDATAYDAPREVSLMNWRRLPSRHPFH